MYKANKRKLFEKAQLKRQYAKVLKKEAATAGGKHEGEAAQSDAVADVGGEERAALSLKRKRKEEAKTGETKQRRYGRDGRGGKGQREQGMKDGAQPQGKPGKWKRPEHRPDPFKAAKVKHVKSQVSSASPQPKRHGLSVHTELPRQLQVVLASLYQPQPSPGKEQILGSKPLFCMHSQFHGGRMGANCGVWMQGGSVGDGR